MSELHRAPQHSEYAARSPNSDRKGLAMTFKTWVAFIVLCLIWGIPYFLIKVALVDLSPAVVAAARIALGAAVLLPIAWHRGVLPQALAHKGAIVAFAFCELVVPFSAVSFAEVWISSSLAGVLIATVPLVVAVIAPLFGIRETFGSRRIVGLVIGFTGVVALLGIDRLENANQWLGAAIAFFAVIGYAVGPLIVQRHLAGVDELGATAASLTVAAIVLAPFAFYFAPTHMPSMTSLGSVVVLGTLCTAVALMLFFYLIHHAGASRAAVVAYINPLVAAVLGVTILSEPFGIGMALGIAMILFGSWLATSGKHESTIEQPVPPSRELTVSDS
jgi:drug/metabolite transporter (DMT)-like permease